MSVGQQFHQIKRLLATTEKQSDPESCKVVVCLKKVVALVELLQDSNIHKISAHKKDERVARVVALADHGVDLPSELRLAIVKLEIKEMILAGSPIEAFVSTLLPFSAGFGGDEAFDASVPKVSQMSDIDNICWDAAVKAVAEEVLLVKVCLGEEGKQWVGDFCTRWQAAVLQNQPADFDITSTHLPLRDLDLACTCLQCLLNTDPLVSSQADSAQVKAMLKYAGPVLELKYVMDAVDTGSMWGPLKVAFLRQSISEASIGPRMQECIDAMKGGDKQVALQHFERACTHLKHWCEETRQGGTDRLFDAIVVYIDKQVVVVSLGVWWLCLLR